MTCPSCMNAVLCQKNTLCRGRRWVLAGTGCGGGCQYGEKCRFPHPPFDLPDGAPPQKDPIAKPAPDAPMWRDLQRVSTLPACWLCRHDRLFTKCRVIPDPVLRFARILPLMQDEHGFFNGTCHESAARQLLSS